MVRIAKCLTKDCLEYCIGVSSETAPGEASGQREVTIRLRSQLRKRLRMSIISSLPSDLPSRLKKGKFLGFKSFVQRVVPDRGPKSCVFVSGVQRSGTNMLMDVLEANLETEVFHESDSRAFDDYELRPVEVLRGLVSDSKARVVILKALLDGDRILDLLQEFAPAKALWMVRSFYDCVNSNLRQWPRGRNMIDELVKGRDKADWRGRGMTDETYSVVL